MKKILQYLLNLLLILTCNSIYFVRTGNLGLYLRIILVLVLVLNFGYVILSKNVDRNRVKKDIIVIIIYYMYLIVFLVLNNNQNIQDFIYLFMIVLPLLYFIYNSSKYNISIELLEKFSKIVVFLSIVSLIFYFFVFMVKVIKPTSYIFISWGKIKKIPTYFNMFFATQYFSIGNHKFLRNTGIFAEAPMYSLSLTIALAIELLILKKKSKKRVIILLITIFTTFSATGIIISSIILFSYFLLKNSNTSLKKITKFLFMPIIFIILYNISLYFFESRHSTSSYFIRMDDFRASYLTWIKNPILGCGYKNNNSIIFNMSYMRMNNTGLSNSILVLLAQCGIYLFSLYFLPVFYSLKKSIYEKKYNIVMFTFVILLLFVFTIFPYRPITMNFIVLGLTYKNYKI